MTDYPIKDLSELIPADSLVQEWLGEYFCHLVTGEISEVERHLVTRAAHWGYQQRMGEEDYFLMQIVPPPLDYYESDESND